MHSCLQEVPSSPLQLHATQSAERCQRNEYIHICRYRCYQKVPKKHPLLPEGPNKRTATAVQTSCLYVYLCMCRCLQQGPTSHLHLHATQATGHCQRNNYTNICMYLCHRKVPRSTRCHQKVPTSARHL